MLLPSSCLCVPHESLSAVHVLCIKRHTHIQFCSKWGQEWEKLRMRLEILGEVIKNLISSTHTYLLALLLTHSLACSLAHSLPEQLHRHQNTQSGVLACSLSLACGHTHAQSYNGASVQDAAARCHVFWLPVRYVHNETCMSVCVSSVPILFQSLFHSCELPSFSLLFSPSVHFFL